MPAKRKPDLKKASQTPSGTPVSSASLTSLGGLTSSFAASPVSSQQTLPQKMPIKHPAQHTDFNRFNTVTGQTRSDEILGDGLNVWELFKLPKHLQALDVIYPDAYDGIYSLPHKLDGEAQAVAEIVQLKKERQALIAAGRYTAPEKTALALLLIKIYFGEKPVNALSMSLLPLLSSLVNPALVKEEAEKHAALANSERVAFAGLSDLFATSFRVAGCQTEVGKVVNRYIALYESKFDEVNQLCRAHFNPDEGAGYCVLFFLKGLGNIFSKLIECEKKHDAMMALPKEGRDKNHFSELEKNTLLKNILVAYLYREIAHVKSQCDQMFACVKTKYEKADLYIFLNALNCVTNTCPVFGRRLDELLGSLVLNIMSPLSILFRINKGAESRSNQAVINDLESIIQQIMNYVIQKSFKSNHQLSENDLRQDGTFIAHCRRFDAACEKMQQGILSLKNVEKAEDMFTSLGSALACFRSDFDELLPSKKKPSC